MREKPWHGLFVRDVVDPGEALVLLAAASGLADGVEYAGGVEIDVLGVVVVVVVVVGSIVILLFGLFIIPLLRFGLANVGLVDEA